MPAHVDSVLSGLRSGYTLKCFLYIDSQRMNTFASISITRVTGVSDSKSSHVCNAWFRSSIHRVNSEDQHLTFTSFARHVNLSDCAFVFRPATFPSISDIYVRPMAGHLGLPVVCKQNPQLPRAWWTSLLSLFCLFPIVCTLNLSFVGSLYL